MSRLLSVLFLLALFVARANASSPTDTCPASSDQVGPRTDVPQWMDQHDAILAASKSQPRSVMIGDSLIQFMPGDLAASWFGTAPLNAGIAGDQVPNILWRAQRIDLASARNIVLLGGINDLAGGRKAPRSVVASLLSTLKTLHEKAPQAQLTLIKLLPTSHPPGSELAQAIAATNRLLDQCAPAAPWLKVVDPGRALLDADGLVAPDLLVDWVHLSKKGYQRLIEALPAR